MHVCQAPSGIKTKELEPQKIVPLANVHCNAPECAPHPQGTEHYPPCGASGAKNPHCFHSQLEHHVLIIDEANPGTSDWIVECKTCKILGVTTYYCEILGKKKR